ncbi:TPA: hypothetical protein ACH3X3_005136 [Trebouxia sp. C0006]
MIAEQLAPAACGAEVIAAVANQCSSVSGWQHNDQLNRLHDKGSYHAALLQTGSWECMSSNWAARDKAAMHAGLRFRNFQRAVGDMTDLVSPCRNGPENKQPQARPLCNLPRTTSAAAA